ncbi:hypothetical protein AAE038_05100 [Bacillus velezensis]|uniref:hypothetical protein n=1 Tax=Bacillus velezensis TaxID=492670 RepID=UPI003136150E
MSGYVVSEWGRSLGIAGIFLPFVIREMKTTAKIPVTLSGMVKAAGHMSLLKISFLSILAHDMIFTKMFGFTTAYALRIDVSEKEISLLSFRL